MFNNINLWLVNSYTRNLLLQCVYSNCNYLTVTDAIWFFIDMETL